MSNPVRLKFSDGDGRTFDRITYSSALSVTRIFISNYWTTFKTPLTKIVKINEKSINIIYLSQNKF